MWEVATWQLPFENLNPYQASAGLLAPWLTSRAGCTAEPLLSTLGCTLQQALRVTQLTTPPPHFSPTLPAPHQSRPPTHLTRFPQIIALVREQGTDSLQLPPPDQLAAGPFAAPGNYEAYHQLMRDCRWAPHWISEVTLVQERSFGAWEPTKNAEPAALLSLSSVG